MNELNDKAGINPAENPPDDAEWEKRRLCDDESCIGVIGPEGCCNVCGRPAASVNTDARTSAPEKAFFTAGEDGTPAIDEAHAEDVDAEWEARRLCSDESCIGVIGPDGRCKVCGKPYKGDDHA